MNQKLKDGLVGVFAGVALVALDTAYLVHQNHELNHALERDGYTPVSVTTNLFSANTFVAKKNDGSVLVKGTDSVFLGTPQPKYKVFIPLQK